MNDKLIEKIQKLLSLAQSDNENESKMASAKASELMLKHNLDLRQVEDSGDMFTSEEFKESTKLSMESKFIVPMLCKAFLVNHLILSEFKTVNGKRKLFKRVTFIGEKTTLKIVTYTYEFLMRSFKDQYKLYLKDHESTKSSRYSFYMGLVRGLQEQFDAVHKKVGHERGLVVVKDPRLDDYFNKLHGKVGYTKFNSPNHINPHAFQSGKNTGRNMRIQRGINEGPTHSNKALTGSY